MRAAFAAGAGQAFTCWSVSSFGSIEPQLTRIRSVQSRLRPIAMVPRAAVRDVETSQACQSTTRNVSDGSLATPPVSSLPATLSEFGVRVLSSPDPAEKVRLTNAAAAFWARADTRVVGTSLGESAVPTAPARPERPPIVESGEMPRAKEASKLGCSRPVYMLHALAHVELNAIDLAWDTALRFGEGMREDWFDDFLSIAVDESRHFGWLSARLTALNSSYGALPAHRIVWDAADCSKTSRRERLAVGQLCQEARGLDAGPKLAERLIGMGDPESARIVKKIAEEEVAHVSIGVRHFVEECERDLGTSGNDTVAIFHEIALRLSNPGAFAPPFNVERRLEAGLDASWYLPVAEEMREALQRRHDESDRLKAAKTPIDTC